MRDWLNWPQSARSKALELYGMVVAAARQPAFYGPGRVPDTPEGRFELVALHLFLLAERLTSEKPDGEELARNLIEAFVTDMDDCMREMGVGDLTVPKRVKRAAAVFYERSGVYRGALAHSSSGATDDTDPLAKVIADAALGVPQTSAFTSSMAAYMRKAHASLAHASYADVASAKFAFAPLQLAAA